MDKTTLTDWSLIQSFLAVAETGSLSAAAAQLGRSQPTMGRHIQTLEEQLGQRLFNRHPRGLHLSPEGEALLPMAQDIHARMHAIGLTAAGQSQDLKGTTLPGTITVAPLALAAAMIFVCRSGTCAAQSG